MSNLAKKIILVVLTLAILGITAYAWAYVNNKVKVDGIQVKPAGSEGLYIAKSAEGTFSATINASTATATLNAVSTADLANWYVPANSVNVSQNGEYTSSDFTLVDELNASEYYYTEKFYVKSTDGAGGLKVSAINVKNPDGTAPDSAVSKSLRVGIKVNSTVYIFAPVAGYDENCEVWSQEGYLVNQTIRSSTNTTVVSGMQANEANIIHVFVWYEGQDGNYNTNNLQNAEELVISIEFTALPLN